MCCLNPLHATWTCSYRNAKLGNNRNDGRQVRLILAMNYHILKITLAVRARNNRNVDNTIDLVWCGLCRRLVPDQATRLEVLFGRLFTRGTYSLRSGTSFRRSSLRLQLVGQSLHFSRKISNLFLKLLAAGTIRLWRFRFHRPNITHFHIRLKYQFQPGKHVLRNVLLDRKTTLVQGTSSSN